jgi:hypothetical protein
MDGSRKPDKLSDAPCGRMQARVQALAPPTGSPPPKACRVGDGCRAPPKPPRHCQQDANACHVEDQERPSSLPAAHGASRRAAAGYISRLLDITGVAHDWTDHSSPPRDTQKVDCWLGAARQPTSPPRERAGQTNPKCAGRRLPYEPNMCVCCAQAGSVPQRHLLATRGPRTHESRDPPLFRRLSLPSFPGATLGQLLCLAESEIALRNYKNRHLIVWAASIVL